VLPIIMRAFGRMRRGPKPRTAAHGGPPQNAEGTAPRQSLLHHAHTLGRYLLMDYMSCKTKTIH